MTKNPTNVERLERELVITRDFNGSAHLVFEAWTKPEHVRRWWAPASHGVSVVSIEADVRVGGRYRYVLKPQDQDAFAFHGEYREIDAPGRVVYTQVFEPFPDAPVLVTVTFVEHGGKTRMTSRELYVSKEVLDMAISSGMEHGMRETLDQLDALVSTL